MVCFASFETTDTTHGPDPDSSMIRSALVSPLRFEGIEEAVAKCCVGIRHTQTSIIR